jgi:hypothetical protein
MAIETLKGLKKVGEFDVVVMDELRKKYPEKFNASGAMDYKWFEKEIRPKNFVYVRHDVNSLSFTLQNGPVGKAGVNGCQVDTIIETSKLMLEGLNEQMPCLENVMAIQALEIALASLALRKANRAFRGVEGTGAA